MKHSAKTSGGLNLVHHNIESQMRRQAEARLVTHDFQRPQFVDNHQRTIVKNGVADVHCSCGKFFKVSTQGPFGIFGRCSCGIVSTVRADGMVSSTKPVTAHLHVANPPSPRALARLEAKIAEAKKASERAKQPCPKGPSTSAPKFGKR